MQILVPPKEKGWKKSAWIRQQKQVAHWVRDLREWPFTRIRAWGWALYGPPPHSCSTCPGGPCHMQCYNVSKIWKNIKEHWIPSSPIENIFKKVVLWLHQEIHETMSVWKRKCKDDSFYNQCDTIFLIHMYVGVAWEDKNIKFPQVMMEKRWYETINTKGFQCGFFKLGTIQNIMQKNPYIMYEVQYIITGIFNHKIIQ